MWNRERRRFARVASVAAAFPLVAALLGGCTYASQQLDSAPGFDITPLKVVPAVADLVPEHIKADGILLVAAELTYPPMEFVAGDGQTAVGLDVDIAKALGRVMGLETQVVSAGFDAIIPAMGSRYEVGISAFTITNPRLDAVNMVSYFAAGSQMAVRIGNPANLDPENICGARIAVQTGTVQQEELEALNRGDCSGNPVVILPYEAQADATANLVGGKADAMYADSPITEFAILQTGNVIEAFGPLNDAAPYGVLISKDDPEFAVAVQAALQYLMDSGTLDKIASIWGNEQGALGLALLNPRS
ncbi:MAG: ABC transporter substrate-binding protein [Cellulomonadaceae bacterium]|jgi:polar amino acid transport system substrate-binding protein|nr:ABC transporter substrate-binding protein [Cellulomonadaceae bacterium]